MNPEKKPGRVKRGKLRVPFCVVHEAPMTPISWTYPPVSVCPRCIFGYFRELVECFTARLEP
jgi:hypothetical protein